MDWLVQNLRVWPTKDHWYQHKSKDLEKNVFPHHNTDSWWKQKWQMKVLQHTFILPPREHQCEIWPFTRSYKTSGRASRIAFAAFCTTPSATTTPTQSPWCAGNSWPVLVQRGLACMGLGSTGFMRGMDQFNLNIGKSHWLHITGASCKSIFYVLLLASSAQAVFGAQNSEFIWYKSQKNFFGKS